MRRAARYSVLVAVLATATLAGRGGNAFGSVSVYPTLVVQYTMSCTFTILNDSGNPVTTIPPGEYQIDVITPIQFGQYSTDFPNASGGAPCNGFAQFQITGPGVDLSTTLDDGCISNDVLPAADFQPNATYTAVDNNQPTITRTTFTTLASGSPAAPANPNTSTAAVGGSASTDVVGSGVDAALEGTLTATLNADGKVSLSTSKGKTPSTLTTGVYRFTVIDHDSKGGFIIRANGAPPIDLTGAKFTGTRSVAVTLTAGIWKYYSNPAKTSTFLVTD